MDDIDILKKEIELLQLETTSLKEEMQLMKDGAKKHWDAEWIQNEETKQYGWCPPDCEKNLTLKT